MIQGNVKHSVSTYRSPSGNEKLPAGATHQRGGNCSGKLRPPAGAVHRLALAFAPPLPRAAHLAQPTPYFMRTGRERPRWRVRYSRMPVTCATREFDVGPVATPLLPSYRLRPPPLSPRVLSPEPVTKHAPDHSRHAAARARICVRPQRDTAVTAVRGGGAAHACWKASQCLAPFVFFRIDE